MKRTMNLCGGMEIGIIVGGEGEWALNGVILCRFIDG